MEIWVNASLPREVNVIFYMTNWKKEFDFSDTMLNENGAFVSHRNPGPVINEVYPGSPGWVEVYNPDGLDLSGYYIIYRTSAYYLPGGTATYQVVSIPNLLSGKTVSLYDAGDVLIDSITPSGGSAGQSYIRYPDGGEWYGWTDSPSPGEANVDESPSLAMLCLALFIGVAVGRRKWLK